MQLFVIIIENVR